MRPHFFESVDQMVSPTGLASVLGHPVQAVERYPLQVAHYSGNILEGLRVRHASGVQRLVLKHFQPEQDWIMRLTHDHAVREVALLRHGVYARLPHLCYVPLIAAARHGGSWTSLMVDVSPALTAPGDAPIPIADLRRYLAHLAAAHARFLQDASLRDPALGLSTLADFLLILTPARAQGEIVQGHSHPVLDAALRGWTVFADVAPPAAAEVITALQRDVRPLLAALDSPPHTLLHGDYKLANLGTLPATDPEQPGTPVVRTIMLDWQDASVGPPLLDVGYFLAITAARLPVTKELALDIYRDALAAAGVSYPQQAWERTVALGLLGGGAMRLLWQPALVTQAADPVARARKQNWPGGASRSCEPGAGCPEP